MSLLSVEDLTIALPPGGDRAQAVSNVSFVVDPGEVLCIVGESGSGKSVTAAAIMGLLPRTLRGERGRILFEGRDLLALPDHAMRALRGAHLGMIFQEPMTALNPLMRVGDQVAEVLAVHGASDAKGRVPELLAAVNLPDPARLARVYPHLLSGGQRQRVMIAIALALEPALLIADEPTTALDVTTQMQILRLIKDIQQRRGTGVLFITHDFGVVAEIADRVAVMQEGRIVEAGAAARVLNAPQHPYTRALIAAVPHRVAGQAQVSGRQVLETVGVRKTYRRGGGLFGGGTPVHAVAARRLRAAPGRDAGPGGRERLRQVNAGPLRRAAGAAGRRRDPLPRYRSGEARPAGVEAVQTAHSDGVPGPVRLAEPASASRARSSPTARSRTVRLAPRRCAGCANCWASCNSILARPSGSRTSSPAGSASASGSRGRWRCSRNC